MVAIVREFRRSRLQRCLTVDFLIVLHGKHVHLRTRVQLKVYPSALNRQLLNPFGTLSDLADIDGAKKEIIVVIIMFINVMNLVVVRLPG